MGRHQTANDAVLESWARVLTDERLALDLERCAKQVTAFAPDQRRAMLNEAARRIREGGR